MSKAKLAIIGIGNMGSGHLKNMPKLERADLVALCDSDEEKAKKLESENSVPVYRDYKEMLEKETLDGIIIATPHYDHTPIAIDAFKKGVSVLTEKPLAVHVNDGKKMIAAYEEAKKKDDKIVFAAMFQQRTHGHWKKIKELIDDGELGKLVRTTWIITDWFRTQTYYDNGGWRATWEGEGGGVLLNQCPHNIDLYQWFVGLPDKVSAFCGIGKYHNIEVEDEVTAYFEYKNGMVGHFITTTAEAPGTNRLEIDGENGKLVYEGGKLTFFRNRESMIKTLKESTQMFATPEKWEINIPYPSDGENGPHYVVLADFADCILDGKEPIAKAPEGINAVMMANAMLYSHFTGKPVEMPLNGDDYEKHLQNLIKNSTFVKEKKNVGASSDDFSKSF